MWRRLVVLASLPLSVGCTLLQDYGGPVAGAVGTYMMADELDFLSSEYYAGALIAYAIYDPLAPTWRMTVTELDENRVRLDMQMKRLVTGGEGEARRLFDRTVDKIVGDGGFAGYEIVRYEEGIDSTRPFARRFASGEIRLSRSQIFPDL